MKPTEEQRKVLAEKIRECTDRPISYPGFLVLAEFLLVVSEETGLDIDNMGMKELGSTLADYIYPEGCEQE